MPTIPSVPNQQTFWRFWRVADLAAAGFSRAAIAILAIFLDNNGLSQSLRIK